MQGIQYRRAETENGGGYKRGRRGYPGGGVRRRCRQRRGAWPPQATGQDLHGHERKSHAVGEESWGLRVAWLGIGKVQVWIFAEEELEGIGQLHVPAAPHGLVW
jgi:hypothetical protein